MHIRVADKVLGECNIKINRDIGKREQYLIKSLCVLQIMCMNSEEEPEKFDEFIDILKETTLKAETLYCEEKMGADELSGTEDFSV